MSRPRPTGVSGWAGATAAAFLALAALGCLAIIPAEIFFDPDANVAGAMMTSLMVAVLNIVLAFVMFNAARSRPAFIVVAVIAAGLGLFALDGAVSLAANHPHASAFVPVVFWVVVIADAIAVAAAVAAVVGMPKTSSSNRTAKAG